MMAIRVVRLLYIRLLHPHGTLMAACRVNHELGHFVLSHIDVDHVSVWLIENRSIRPNSRLGMECLLFLLDSNSDVEAVTGDLEERRTRIAKVSGIHHATLWYWSQVFRSIVPFAWAAFKRVSGLEAVAEAWRRMR